MRLQHHGLGIAVGCEGAIMQAFFHTRMVLPDNQLATPGWTRLDLGARWTQKAPGRNLVWRAGLDNVTDARAWKEAPLQFGHLYLYPLASRTLRLSLTAAL